MSPQPLPTPQIVRSQNPNYQFSLIRRTPRTDIDCDNRPSAEYGYRVPSVQTSGATEPQRRLNPLRLLLVDDQPLLLEQIARRLRADHGMVVTTCVDSRKVQALVDATPFDAVVTDLDMPLLDGRKVLEQVVASHPGLPVVVLTGHSDVATAVSCMRIGAVDFLTKPVKPEHLVAVLERAMERSELDLENQRLSARLKSPKLAAPQAFDGIITNDPVMRAIFQYLEVISPSSHPVLITGETGTGKELIARSIQRLSRPNQPLVAVNVAGLDDTVFADTLFGHRKGAFTGADSNRPGLIEGAAGGTLFLDEIGDLSLTSQVKLLRLLQEGEYLPLGADKPSRTDCRFVVATCRTMEELRDPTRFRKDLYYRLKAHHVQLPALRERPQDIALLAGHFLAEACDDCQLPPASLAADAQQLLLGHAFPGNIRELQSVMRDAVTRSQATILTAAHLTLALGADADSAVPVSSGIKPASGTALGIPAQFPTLKEAGDQLITEALTRAQGNHTLAARMLGLTRQGLYNRLRAGSAESDKS